MELRFEMIEEFCKRAAQNSFVNREILEEWEEFLFQRER